LAGTVLELWGLSDTLGSVIISIGEEKNRGVAQPAALDVRTADTSNVPEFN